MDSLRTASLTVRRAHPDCREMGKAISHPSSSRVPEAISSFYPTRTVTIVTSTEHSSVPCGSCLSLDSPHWYSRPLKYYSRPFPSPSFSLVSSYACPSTGTVRASNFPLTEPSQSQLLLVEIKSLLSTFSKCYFSNPSFFSPPLPAPQMSSFLQFLYWSIPLFLQTPHVLASFTPT